MKQFGTIFSFELKNYLKNKIFVGVTVFLAALIAVVMFLPRITGFFKNNENPSDDEKSVMLVYFDSEICSSKSVDGVLGALFPDTGAGQAERLRDLFAMSFPGYNVQLTNSTDEILETIASGEAECAFCISSLTSYTYYVNNLSMYDVNTTAADELLKNIYQMSVITESGVPVEKAADIIISSKITHKTENLGKDQIQNFFYTYIMIFALYMVILLYGQMVATNVATEKSSRAMELLITSANPVSMMFGKVLAACLAGFIQLVAIFGTSILFFNLNKSYWDGNMIINSIFNMPLDLLLYMLLFFVLGFFMYAFMFGAVGSTATKLEDINTSVMPITMLFVIGFVIVITSMAGGNIDGALMTVCSYIPFTSPMAMFTRIAMSTVPAYGIAISVAILAGSVVFIGILSAKIYRVGVLLYGTSPKLKNIIKSVIKA